MAPLQGAISNITSHQVAGELRQENKPYDLQDYNSLVTGATKLSIFSSWTDTGTTRMGRVEGTGLKAELD